MTIDTNGEVETKCKGFNNLATLLHANNKETLIEDLLLDSLHPFLLQVCPDLIGAKEAADQPLPTVSIFQRQIVIDARALVPDVRDRPNFAKKLRMIGPRRIIDGYHWLRFNCEEGTKVSGLANIKRPKPPNNNNGCTDDQELQDEANDADDEEDNDEDVDAPSSHFKVLPSCIVPTYPYGYHPPDTGMPFAYLMNHN